MSFMNTEINLLKRKERSYLVLIIILTIAVLVALLLGTYVQKYLADEQIDTHKKQIESYETEIHVQEKDKLRKRNLLSIQKDIETIRKERMLVKPLNEAMMRPLVVPEQMESYGFNPTEEGATIEMTIDLVDLNDVAYYMQEINELVYINDIMFSRIIEKEGAVTVDFSVNLDILLLREELAKEDE